MSDGDASGDPFAAARANLRDTVKWLVAAFAALAAATLGSSPLTGLGSLSPGWRLYLAIVGGMVGLVFVFIAIYTSLKVLAAKPFYLAEVRQSAELGKYIGEHATDLLPPEFGTFNDFIQYRDRVMQALRTLSKSDSPARLAAEKSFTDLKPYVDRVLGLAYFVTLRNDLMNAARRLLWLALGTAVALGVFGWAANPPKDQVRPSASDGNLRAAAVAEAANPIVRHLTELCGRPSVVTERLPARSEAAALEYVWTTPGACRGISLIFPVR